ncbi:cytoplasmic polyadenylation element-binding protein-like [Eurosta solidaginis]|uniref:cytoplasmic polyadenylation element-binding protein-like n=1 Tax=Eurosta solidaginis TaxID=178769 RepID=UPI0035306691
MAVLVKTLLAVLFYCQYLCSVNATTLSPLYITHPVDPQQKYNEYVSPYTTESYAQESVNYSTNLIRQPIYQSSKKTSKIYQPITQTTNKDFNNTISPTQKLYSSYAAPASGSAPYSYSMPQRSNLVPLPRLFPKSLIDQLSSANVQKQQQEEYAKQQQHYRQLQLQEQLKSQKQHHQQQQQQHHQQQIQSKQGHNVDIIKSNDLPLTIDQPLLMVEEPMATLIKPNQSRTLAAARILASTLLQASGEAILETPGLRPLSNPNALDLPNHLNSTDFLIVKSQKNAYIIPMPLAKDARNPSMVQSLYQMRDQLEKAYTINQFIFIIKPEKINFLNKLV